MNKRKHLVRAFFFFFIVLIVLPCFLSTPAFCESIAEKKASLNPWNNDLDPALQERLKECNEKLKELFDALNQEYAQAQLLFDAGVPQSTLEAQLQNIQDLKKKINAIESTWQKTASTASKQEAYSLWHQPETTLGEMVIDFGSSQYLYVMTPEIAQQKICLNSQLPIPRAAWTDMLELILSQRGIGVRPLNPFLRQLYMIKQEPLGPSIITSNRRDLDLMPPQENVCFLLSTHSPDPVRIFDALQRFAPPDRSVLHLIGKAIIFSGNAQDVKEMLKLHDFIAIDALDREYRLMMLTKIQGKEMELIIQAYFQHSGESESKNNSSSLKTLSFASAPQSLFILGTKEQLALAEKIIRDIETQLQDPLERTCFWYTCKHTEADDLAKVLGKVYNLMVNTPLPTKDDKGSSGSPINIQDKVVIDADGSGAAPYALPNSLVVNPGAVNNAGLEKDKKEDESFGNFIVDTKSNAIIMVVELEYLARIKELLRKLDQPKKMVQIEVLLFEKRITDRTAFGLNLLRMGAIATGTSSNSLAWNFDPQTQTPNESGLLSLLISRKSHGHIPNFDLAYNFLLTQEDVHINASPSITTVNQTPAKIAIVEEISINTGVYNTGGGFGPGYLENAYARAQYGITIEITPTIHVPDESDIESDGCGYITLDTEVTFDTPKPSRVDRPDVIRRNIKNQVRIADGQTVILGGLRRKNSQDNAEKIPFLGEIPGLGKLFSMSVMHDLNTEMFIFITPKIIYNSKEDLQRQRTQELCKRPGDIPPFLACLAEAQSLEKRRLFEGGMKMLFGRPSQCPPCYRINECGYDGD